MENITSPNDDFWRFNIVITKLYEEDAQLEASGLTKQNDEKEDQMVPYYLSKNVRIASFRQSWVIFKEEYKNCVIVNFVPEGGIGLMETPPLIINCENFLKTVKR